jgi:hypothetical protein
VPSFQLNPGVLVDAERGEAYVMSPEGGIVAVGLTDGAPVWRSSKAEKPLTLAGELLIGQAETPGPANVLRIVTLDTGKRGEQVNEALVELPPGVQAMVGPSLNRSFTAEARAEPEEREEVAISWQFVERPLRGIAPGPIEVLPGEASPAVSVAPAPMGALEPGGEPTIVRGAARVDVSSGTVTATEATRMPGAPGQPTVSAGDSAAATDLGPGELLPGVPDPQFLSADGRHVLSSQRVADDPEWDKYLWTIFERDSGRRVGELRTHLRYAPFFVDNTRVICQTPPYERLQGPDMVQEPLQLRAVDLSTGAQVWSQPVRDTVGRQPPPP